MVSDEDISHWQNAWKVLLDMAYFSKDPVSTFSPHRELNYEWEHSDPEFEKLTFDYAWREYSKQRDGNGEYIEPRVIPELTNLSVPYDLFYCLGVSTFMKKCFPNCEVAYWD